MPGGTELCVVSATGIQDPTGQIFANGTWQLIFKPNYSSPGPPVDTGVSGQAGPNFIKLYGGSLDASGSFSIGSVVRNDSIAPAGTKWTLVVSPNSSSQAFSLDLVITTTTLDVTPLINAVITNILISATVVAHAYKDSEVIPVPGSGGFYYDVTNNVLKVYNVGTSSWITVGQTVNPFAPVTHNFLTGLAGGFFSSAQPVEADVVGLVADLAAKAPLASPTFTGTVNLPRIGDSILFAEDFTDVPTAIAALPSTGGIIFAISSAVNLALGALNPGTKAVTLYLGSLPFTATQITLQTNFHIIGCGSSNQTGSGQTKITSVGSNATPLIIIPQASNSPAQGVQLKGIRFVGAAANTSQKGLFADCSTLTNSGLWYPEIEDCVFDSFVGNPIHLQGRPDNATAVNQFGTFINVRAFRAASGAEALRINGGNGQFKFIGCQFDGPGITDSTAPNIFIGQTGAGDAQQPYSIDFDLLTCQGSNLGVQLSGSAGINFRHCHWENLHGCIQTNLVGLIANYNVNVESNDFSGTVGVNAGNGFIWKDNSNQTRGMFKNNMVQGTPDKIIVGTNGASIVPQDNIQTSVPPVWNSTNLTFGFAAAATLNCESGHSFFVNTSATQIATIQSSLGPGEVIYFRANGGPITFVGGGNINLGSNNNPLTLSGNDIAAFQFDDADNQWNLVSYSGRQKSANAIDTTGLTANVAATTLLASPNVLGGLYRVTALVVLTTAASVSSTLPNVQIVYTDAQTNGSVTLDATPILGTAGIGQTGTLTANTVGTTSSGVMAINAKVGTVVQYQTVNYSSSIAGMAYALHVRIEPLN